MSPRKTASSPTTRLSKVLAEGVPERATPLHLFELATRQWVQGQRVDVGALASELGIGRATAFRWVGSRDQLLGEILWSQCETSMRSAVKAYRSRVRGPRRIAAICERGVREITRSTPLRRFLRAEPEQALRLLTSKLGPVQARAIARVRELLDAEAQAGKWKPPLKLDTLAYLVVRLCESFIYAQVMSAQRVDPADAALAVELLLSGRVSGRAAPKSRRKD